LIERRVGRRLIWSVGTRYLYQIRVLLLSDPVALLVEWRIEAEGAGVGGGGICWNPALLAPLFKLHKMQHYMISDSIYLIGGSDVAAAGISIRGRMARAVVLREAP
jgi:hypothetical protein